MKKVTPKSEATFFCIYNLESSADLAETKEESQPTLSAREIEVLNLATKKHSNELLLKNCLSVSVRLKLNVWVEGQC